MPAISLIPVPLYEDLQPYVAPVDNIPIIGIIEQLNCINNATDNNTIAIYGAAGTAGNVETRLNQSLDSNGNLLVEAINIANHSIENHVDTSNFVRMTILERAKLSYIASDATSLAIQVDTISGSVPFINSTMEIAASDTVQWTYQNGKVYAQIDFPAAVRHIHYYGLVPVSQNILSPDFINFYVTSVQTQYQQGSLRVYVNGTRLNENGNVYVPIGQPSSVSYVSMSYSENTATNGIVTTGGFALSTPLPLGSSFVVDFDVLY